MLIGLIALIASLAAELIMRLVMGLSILPLVSSSPDAEPLVGAVDPWRREVASVVVYAVDYIITGAMMNAAIKQVRGQGLQLGALGEIIQVLGNLIVLALLQAFAIGIGMSLCILPAFVVAGLLMFSIPLVVDQKIGGVEAIRRRFQMLKSQWLMATLFFIVAAFLGIIGAVLCGVGILLTWPLFSLSIAVAYNDFVEGASPA